MAATSSGGITKERGIHSLTFLLEKASEIDDIENGRSVLVLLLAVVVP
jgi:hypothetical protein